MRVLLTAAGRRNYLVRYFQQAGATVIAADTSKYAAALAAADIALRAPLSNVPEYPDFITDVCRDYDVDLALSVNDHDLLPLSRMKGALAEVGTTAIVADPDIVQLAADKVSTNQLAERLGIGTVRMWTSVEEALGAADPPRAWVVKRRFGSGSTGLFVVQGPEELQAGVALSPNNSSSRDEQQAEVVIQEFLQGEEYGLDVLNDFQGSHTTTWVKRKLRMRAGETDLAEVVQDHELVSLGAEIGRELQHPGLADVDVIRTSSGLKLLDINPRFGGGYPFSHAAGANAPACLVAWKSEEPLHAAWLNPSIGTVSAKYDLVTQS